MPLLPRDFNRRHFNAAHPDLITQGFLRGGEAVRVVNASRLGTLEFNLPVVSLEAVVMFNDGDRVSSLMNLDTVTVNTDENRVFAVWRTHFVVHRRTHDIAWVKTQSVDSESGR
jgi:hypothetical protein